MPDGLNDYMTTEDGMVKLRVCLGTGPTGAGERFLCRTGRIYPYRYSGAPFRMMDWLPINEERAPLCPTLRVRIMTALPDGPNVVSYRRRITQDED